MACRRSTPSRWDTGRCCGITSATGWSDYREWSGQRSKGESYAAVCYLSQYGFSDRISQAIAHGIGKADAQVQLVDLRATDPQELTALIGDAQGCCGADLARGT